MTVDVDTLVTQSVGEVFATMLEAEVTPVPFEVELPNGHATHLVGTVGFVGPMEGVVYVYVSDGFARRATSVMLRVPEAEIQGESMVNDAIGELTDMIVGQWKSRMAEQDIFCTLTVPSIIRGIQFSIEPDAFAQRTAVGFKTAWGRVSIEVLIRRPASEPSESPGYRP